MLLKPHFSDQETKTPICKEYTMYPKVKVKEQEQDDDLLPVNLRPALKDCDYFSTYDFNSPVSEYEDDSPTSVVRIPDSYVSSLPHLSQGEAKSRNNNRPAEQNFTKDIKVAPIPPPRAVLSSPDNDGLMRSKHKGKAEMVSGAKDHNLCKNRRVSCKETSRRNSLEITKITKQEPKETRDTNSNPKEKTKASVANAKQRVCARKKKPDWVSPYIV